MSRLQSWLKPKVRRAREADTARQIADAPTTFAHRRGAVDLTAIEGRILAPGPAYSPNRGDGSLADKGAVLLLFPVGADVRAEDRLAAAGGVAYRATFVHPAQTGRTLVSAEVATR